MADGLGAGIVNRPGPLTALEVALLLWDEHPDYPTRTTIVSRVGEKQAAGVPRTGDEWVRSILDMFDPAHIADPRDRVLHGKLLIYGLCKIDEPLHRYLAESGVLDELRQSITPDPETLLQPVPGAATPDQHAPSAAPTPPRLSQSARLIADTPATEDLLD